MSIISDTRGAFTQAILSIDGIDADDIAWENKDFDPPAGVWYQTYFMPNTFDGIGKASSDDREDVGIYQITVMMENNSNSYDTPQLDAIAAILDKFASGSTLSYNAVSVEINSASITPGRISGGYFARDITINYQTQNGRV